MKYYLKIVRVHHKFIDRLYSKYPALTNPFNKLSLQQILNKREFNFKNKRENQIQNFKNGLDMYTNLKNIIDNARHTHEENNNKLDDLEEFLIYKIKRNNNGKDQQKETTAKREREKIQ